MNTREAKEILLLYRGPIDDSDPQFHAALDYAKTDPELGQWLREQTKCYDTIRAKLRAIEPPLGLSEKIVRRRPIPFPRDWSRIVSARCGHPHLGQCHRAADEMVGAPPPFCRGRAGNSRDWRSARYDLLHRLQLERSRSRQVRERCASEAVCPLESKLKMERFIC